MDHLRKVFFIGGQETPKHKSFETWSWDEVSGWQQWKGATQPDSLWGARAYDSVRQKIVYLAQHHSKKQTTWEWNERTGWVEVKTRNVPPTLQSAKMAFDPARRRVVLSASSSQTKTSWMWEYDGTDWFERKPQTMPPWRHGGSMVYAEALG